ncbi:MAG TPA: hypothetical protein VIY69_13270 [Candidatus Acidoferrales bacterium]
MTKRKVNDFRSVGEIMQVIEEHFQEVASAHETGSILSKGKSKSTSANSELGRNVQPGD